MLTPLPSRVNIGNPLVSIAPDWSVIIASYNSSGTLDRCLVALEQSSLRPAECLVIVDGSTDESESIARRHGARVVALRERQGPAHARNLGARLAQGEWILFLDSDVCIHPDGLARIVEALGRDCSLDAVMGAYDDTPAATPFLAQYRNLLHCFTHRTGRREASTFWAGCGAIRKDAFFRSGGLDERYNRPAIEDLELGLRLRSMGGRILLDPAVQVKHLKCWTLSSMVRTDVWDRGVPWTRLILRTGRMPNDLNVRWTQRLSVGLSALLVPALAWGAPRTALACLIAVIGLNLPFLWFLRRKRGIRFAFSAVPVHVLFHIYSGIAFGLGVAFHLASALSQSGSRPAPEETT